MSHVEILRQVPLFASLTDDQVAAAADWFRVENFDQDAMIFLEGDPADRLWVVAAGQVKIVKHTSDGQENLLEVITPGEMFGGTGLLLAIHPATAVAMTPTVTLCIERGPYLHLIRQYPDIALRIIYLLGERLQAAMKMRALAVEHVDVRLANILLKLCDKAGEATDEGTRINLPLSRQDLADMAGTTIETAIRVMSRFRKDGLAHTEPGGYIVVLDHERLQLLSEGAEY
ncbi:MAG TPA: Crp/Fnr family transcriptional regulator [Anaerolineae bacterium]|nr:Crp/Fnr family transcriptional regulator [Anaerolineae bacterium]